jgi:isopenicillin N synthase-like dioxygenase
MCLFYTLVTALCSICTLRSALCSFFSFSSAKANTYFRVLPPKMWLLLFLGGLILAGVGGEQDASCAEDTTTQANPARLAPSVPVIDLAPFTRPADYSDEERKGTMEAWDAAFSSVGFATVVNHGIPSALLETLVAEMETFFELPLADKLRSQLSPTYGAGGFTPEGVEAVAHSTGASEGGEAKAEAGAGAGADGVESFVFKSGVSERDKYSSLPSGFIPTSKWYFAAAEELALMLMSVSAGALGLPPDHFDAFYSRAHCLGCHLRLAHYPPTHGADSTKASQRYGSHTDYTGFTLLYQDQTVGGLEVRTQSGEWVPVPVVPGALIVNAGDLIPLWTAARWVSAWHRVPAPTDPSLQARHRYSIVFFTGPDDEKLITPIWGGSGHTPVTAGEHLRVKIMRTSLVTPPHNPGEPDP